MADAIGTLSMYDWPETRVGLEHFWDLIKTELRNSNLPAPDILQQGSEQMPLWLSPDLVIGQTCGWPYANVLRGKVAPFARFDYGLPGCPKGYYRSVYIGQSMDDQKYLKDACALSECPTVAINGDDSQSGFHVFSEISGVAASSTISPEQRLVTGAHRSSVVAVANGDAQIAAIDAVAFELAKRYEAEAAGKVHVIGYSTPKPGLPLITSPQLALRRDDLLQAVIAAHSNLSADKRDHLLIKEVMPASDVDYEVFAPHN